LIDSSSLIWQYLLVGGSEQKAQLAFVLGRDDFSIPEKTVEIYEQSLVQKIILLGGRGRLTGGIEGSESQAFKKFILSRNIPEEVIYMEENSTNTGENITEGLKLLKNNSLFPRTICIVTHAPHMRRALAVAKAQDSSIEWLPCPDGCVPPQVDSATFRKELEELVGEVSRLEKYPELGFFEKQNIPDSIFASKKIIEQWLALPPSSN